MKIKRTTVHVNDQEKADYEQMKARGAEFVTPPTEVTGSKIAKLNDSCGNLIQITRLMRWEKGGTQ